MQSEVLQPAVVQTMAPTFRLKYPSMVQEVVAVQSGGAQWRADAPRDMGKWAQAWRSGPSCWRPPETESSFGLLVIAFGRSSRGSESHLLTEISYTELCGVNLLWRSGCVP